MSDDSSTTKVYTGEWGAFATSVVTNIIILAVILVAFFIIRALRNNIYLYQPQYFDRYAKLSNNRNTISP